MANLVSEFGAAVAAVPISSTFEVSNFEKKVSGQKHVKLLSWSPNSDGKLTFERLKHVVCLDMKGIQLTNLPPEIGLCENLECLDVRDNCLENLPPELSQCTKLRTLLFSGNHLDYKNQMQALIDLRQLNQPLGGAPSFKWTQPNAMFTVMTWNIGAQHAAKQTNFPKCPARFLQWDYRAELFIHTVLNLKPHIVCIQEVEEEQLETLSERMRTIGYGCAPSFASRPRKPGVPIVGVATFFLKARLAVEKTITVSFSDLPGNENITKGQLVANEAVFQVSVIRLQTQSVFLINAGLHPCRFQPQVLLAQMHIMAERVDSLNGHVLICGSLGFKPGSPPHTLMSTGEDPSGKFKLRRTYRCAYAESSVPIDFTEWAEDELITTDYIWISSLLSPNGYVVVPTKEEAKKYHRTAPNSQWPSNHIPIGVAVDLRAAPPPEVIQA